MKPTEFAANIADSSNNEQLTREIHNYFSNNEFDKCLNMAADDVQVTAYAIGTVFNGKEQFMGFMQAFPDLVIHHTNILSNGSRVAVEFQGQGTHTGDLQTPMGAIAASGKVVNFNVAEFMIWENGKLKSIANYQDAATMLRQIGAL